MKTPDRTVDQPEPLNPEVIYLDHAATTPLRPEAWLAMQTIAEENYGNPSGSHQVSRAAKRVLEDARELIASGLGVHPLEIVFTGGGTEADVLALQGSTRNTERDGIVTVATEHEAILDTAHFLERSGHPLRVVGVDRYGRVESEEVATAVDHRTAVVSVMAVNNETGTIGPVAEVVERVKKTHPDCLLHTDAVQAVMTDLNLGGMGVDLASFAAHKFGGPKGVGMLMVRSGVELEPVLHGGGQELGRRSGTQDVMGVVGMAAALEAAIRDRDRFNRDVTLARQNFEQGLGELAHRTIPTEYTTPQHCHLLFPGVHSDTLLVRLDRRGVAASAGSACQSGAVGGSHVLEAIGMSPEESRTGIRFSFGWNTKPEDGTQAAERVTEALTAFSVKL